MSNIIDSIQLSGVTYQIQGSGGGGVPESTFTAYTASTNSRIAEDEEVTAAALNVINESLSGKQATLVSGTNIKTINNESLLGSGNITIQGGGGTVDQTIISGSTNAVAGGAVYDKFDEVEEVTAAGLNVLNDSINAVSGAIPTTTSAVTSGSTAVVTSGGVYDQLGGLKLLKLTQSAYDALSPNYDSNTLYVIVN